MVQMNDVTGPQQPAASLFGGLCSKHTDLSMLSQVPDVPHCSLLRQYAQENARYRQLSKHTA
jgi:hypothetical protein